VANPQRVENRAQLIEALEAALAAEGTTTWVARLNAAGIAAGPVNDIGAALDLARALDLDPTLHLGDEHPDQVRHAVTWGRSELPVPTPPPALGEHTEQIRRQLAATPKEQP
jgi:formyl-CoA transferase